MPRTKARSEAWRFARLSSKGRSPLQPNFIPGTKIVEQHGAGDDVRSVKVGDNELSEPRAFPNRVWERGEPLGNGERRPLCKLGWGASR